MATYPRRGPAVAALVLLIPVAACTRGTAHRTTPATTPAAVATTPAAAATTPAAGSSADGTWSGTWARTSPPPTTGTMTIVLHSDGATLSGTITVQGSACLTQGTIGGSVTGDAVALHATTPAVSGGGQATGDYAGTLAGGKLTGTLTVTCAVGVGTGTFDLSRK